MVLSGGGSVICKFDVILGEGEHSIYLDGREVLTKILLHSHELLQLL